MTLLSGDALFAGAGITTFAVFDPVTRDGASTAAASAAADAFHAHFQGLMDEHEVWGIELLTREGVTSAALQHLGTSAPQWQGSYTPQWRALLNSNELITYGATGTLGARGDILWDIWDFITGHKIVQVGAAGSTDEAARATAARAIAALQLYLSEIVEVKDRQVVVNIGMEAVSTGTMLRAYGHVSHEPHAADYPPHGHREHDDHLLNSQVYSRYASQPHAHTHQHGHAHETGAASPELTKQRELATKYDGRQTGLLKVVGFRKPNPYYNAHYAICEVQEGFALSGGFVTLMPEMVQQ